MRLIFCDVTHCFVVAEAFFFHVICDPVIVSSTSPDVFSGNDEDDATVPASGVEMICNGISDDATRTSSGSYK